LPAGLSYGVDFAGRKPASIGKAARTINPSAIG
jgi:hypothetical protein